MKHVRLLVLGAVAAISLLLVLLLAAREAKHLVTIEFANVSEAKVFSLVDESKPVKLFNSPSKESLGLENGPYKIIYTGSGNYQSGELSFDVDGESLDLVVSPPYKNKELESLLQKEAPVINDLLARTYPEAAGSYEVQKGRLFSEGEWYGTTFRYIGSDVFNSDTLRVALGKEDGVWKIKSIEPSIYLSVFNSPDVPRDILIEINKL